MIFIGCDHTGFELKEAIIKYFDSSLRIVDSLIDYQYNYPEMASLVCSNVLQDSKNIGILICGSGIGMSIAANRHKGIRAALCHSTESAVLSKEHNNANIICLGARMLPILNQIEIVKSFLTTTFQGGRHIERIKQIDM